MRGFLIDVRGRRHTGSQRKTVSLVEQDSFERGHKQQYIILLAGVAHQADAPDFAFYRTNSAGDFDIEFIEQLAA